MRRVLTVTAAQAVGITSLLVGGTVAGLLLWPGDPLASLAGDPASLDGTPPTLAVVGALVVAIVAASLVSLGVAKLVADTRAERVGGLLVTLGAPDDKGRRIVNLAPVEPEGAPKLVLDDDQQVYRMWLDADQVRRLEEGRYFGSVVRTIESCWIRGDLSGDPVFFMDNTDAPPDSEGAGSFYNKAPRVSVFKGASYTCEPVK